MTTLCLIFKHSRSLLLHHTAVTSKARAIGGGPSPLLAKVCAVSEDTGYVSLMHADL